MNQIKPVLIFILFFVFAASNSIAEIRLPKIVQDSMILQRNSPLKIWGWAAPREVVTIRFNGKSIKTSATSEGKWLATFPAMKAGGPYEMRLQGENTIVLKDILIGDVWLCAGQSNMVHQMGIHNITYA